MLDFIKKIINFFSIYAHPFEKKVDKFLSKLNSNTNKNRIHRKVLELMEENIVMFHLWCERRYKGYKYLSKKRRNKLYANAEKIRNAFNTFCSDKNIDINALLKHIPVPSTYFNGKENQLKYIACIMDFFSGSQKHFKYEKSCNFGKLLKDPTKSQLIGDCNQIVTLYTYIFGLKYDISELKIKTYPGHVCLHYNGVDIEATNGSFQHYRKEGQKILPITELAAINLLDVSDSNEKMFEISPYAFIEAAKLTFLLSNNEEITKHNLKAAHQKLVNKALKDGHYQSAIEYSEESKDKELMKIAYHNAGVHFLKNNQFTKAISLFKKIDNKNGIKSCYEAMFIKLNKEIANLKTVDQLKAKRYTLQKMKEYAEKAGNHQFTEHVASLMKQIK